MNVYYKSVSFQSQHNTTSHTVKRKYERQHVTCAPRTLKVWPREATKTANDNYLPFWWLEASREDDFRAVCVSECVSCQLLRSLDLSTSPLRFPNVAI